jgi:hypothetical protein
MAVVVRNIVTIPTVSQIKVDDPAHILRASKSHSYTSFKIITDKVQEVRRGGEGLIWVSQSYFSTSKALG